MTTRRKFGLGGIAAIIAAQRAPAALVRSLVASRHIAATGTRLPYDAEVECLESTGTQWIDTGIKCSSNVGIKVSGEMLDTTYGLFPAMIGAQNDSETNYFGVYEDSGIVYIGNANAVEVNINTRFTAEINYLNSGIIKVSYSQSTVQEHASFGSINSNICVFGMGKETVEISCISKSRVYDVVISKGDQDIMKLNNVRVGTEGVMYDRVSGQLFRNKGTGSFITGPVKARGVSGQNGGGYKWIIIASDSGPSWRPHLQRWRQSPSSWKEAT